MTQTPDMKDVERTLSVVRQRIRDHGEYLSLNETRTRMLLVDPLLRALGWDLEEPSDVQIEFHSGRGRPDYALMRGDEPVAVIEAKKLDDDLGGDFRSQLFQYANAPRCPRVRLAVLTDGDEWNFWRQFSRRNIDGQLKISSGRPRSVARDLVEYLSPSQLGVRDTQRLRRAGRRPTRTRRGNWYPLVGDLPEGQPAAVQLGDAAPSKWKDWRKLYADVAEYLYSTGYIRKSDFPVYVVPNGNYCAINDKPIHPKLDGKPFGVPVQIRRDMWLETWGSRRALRDYAGRLLRDHHSDPESVQVRFD